MKTDHLQKYIKDILDVAYPSNNELNKTVNTLIINEIKIESLSNQQKQIYHTLNRDLQSTKEIADACKLTSKNVSSILISMLKTTNLIAVNSKGRLKLWSLK